MARRRACESGKDGLCFQRMHAPRQSLLYTGHAHGIHGSRTHMDAETPVDGRHRRKGLLLQLCKNQPPLGWAAGHHDRQGLSQKRRVKRAECTGSPLFFRRRGQYMGGAVQYADERNRAGQTDRTSRRTPDRFRTLPEQRQTGTVHALLRRRWGKLEQTHYRGRISAIQFVRGLHASSGRQYGRRLPAGELSRRL